MTLRLTINGVMHDVVSASETPLAYVLRDELKLKGTKIGCGLEQCGACAVLVDGAAVLSCVSPAGTFEGKEITTIEGLSKSKLGARVQSAFIEATAAQCGYCTAGMVVAVTGLLSKTPKPDRETVKRELAPHLCRCGSHPRILRAVEIASGQA